jgi:cyclin B
MSTQNEINEKMRGILIDWLVDVHLKFRLLPETLHLAVDILDRYLEQRTVTKGKLQLVGIVALLLAAKYEEMYPPEIKEFIFVSAEAFSRDEILRMERQMLAVLNFNLTVPTVYPFLIRGLQVTDADKVTTYAAQFLAEMCLLEYKMLLYLPSTIAASCILVANKLLGNKETWLRNLEHYSGYKISQLERCARDIVDMVRAIPTQKLQSVNRKYNLAKFGEVSRHLISAAADEVLYFPSR